ncbi:lytic polysaccharide monooxygenase auxiliary activity family 9 protein [Allostreptomyces psammosilenae]|uniref:Chitin-binding protein n=1 Tax=Allostreptomyces psammosilenae TaxID=1892865 RepID=A0A852ZMW0_9ACTN|nr:lytic polysaccharide monooxygenase [Allostreptomyces psammosilenae]NYI03739.1 chitin-binding protein [Allostreptomyces psammosilenae]
MHLAPKSSARRRAVFAPALLAAALLSPIPLANDADAHGTVTNPPTRNYGCLERWGANEPNQAQDPMCHSVYQANPSAITSWKAVYANGTGDNYRQVIPDGQICSAGRNGETDYSALDRPGPWVTTAVNSNFTVNVYDEARHGADWLHVYVTRQGYDPTTQPLRWSDLELVKTTGSYPGGASPNYVTDASVGGRSGRHVVVTVWQASHMDQKYFLCSDVSFGGTSSPNPTNPPDPAPTACLPTTWHEGAVYTNNDTVTWNGHNWRAKWWVTGEEPGTTGQWGVWEDLGACTTNG